LITAREMNIAIPINQIVPLANPDNAATLSLLPGERGVTPKNAETISAIIVTAPIGSTLRMMAKIVAAKMANICHAWRASPSGGGVNQIITPKSIVRIAFHSGKASFTSRGLLSSVM
jgi:hypothetical protein